MSYFDSTNAYTYDPVGNRLGLTTTAGVVNYQYDAANRLTSVNGQAYIRRDNIDPEGFPPEQQGFDRRWR